MICKYRKKFQNLRGLKTKFYGTETNLIFELFSLNLNMQKSYKYKLRPNVEQEKKFAQAFGCMRYVYNWGLDIKVKTYEFEKKIVSYNELAKMLTLLRKEYGKEWLGDVSTTSLQQSLRSMETAFINFFRGCKDRTNVGFPKFKSKHKADNVVKFVGGGVHINFEKWQVRLPKIGWVEMCYNKPFDMSKVKVGTITVSQDKCKEYWCSINVDTGEPLPPKAKVAEGETLGIDLGIKNFATMSDGTVIANPKFLEKSMRRLAHLQRVHARRRKGSNRRERARIALAKCHRHIANCRNDFLHKLTTALVRSGYTSFAIEDLNVQGMEKNHNLAQSVASASWPEFVRQLTYKAEWYGKNILRIGRFEPSSRTCSVCGWHNEGLTLNDRSWTCPECGTHHDRDVNASINIKNMALAVFREICPCVGGLKDAEGRGCEPCETSKVFVTY